MVFQLCCRCSVRELRDDLQRPAASWPQIRGSGPSASLTLELTCFTPQLLGWSGWEKTCWWAEVSLIDDHSLTFRHDACSLHYKLLQMVILCSFLTEWMWRCSWRSVRVSESVVVLFTVQQSHNHPRIQSAPGRTFCGLTKLLYVYQFSRQWSFWLFYLYHGASLALPSSPNYFTVCVRYWCSWLSRTRFCFSKVHHTRCHTERVS